ncbi:MAG: sigma-70 family RNA polymerase sigma factor [Myxococcota bacterium]
MADAKSPSPRSGTPPKGRATRRGRPSASRPAPAQPKGPPEPVRAEASSPKPPRPAGDIAARPPLKVPGEDRSAKDGREAARALSKPAAKGSKATGEGESPKRFKGLPPPTKDMSRAELAKQYGPYVRSIAGKIKKTLSKDIEFDDLYSYGMLGLMEAADRFDAKYGANFMTFAYYRVRGAIYDGLRGMGWVSRTEYQKYRYEQHANEYLRTVAEQEAVGSGSVRKSDDDEVAEIADAVEGLVTIYVTALDAMEGFQIADESGPAVDEKLEVQQARRLVAEAIEKLPEQERTLLTLYYYKELSLEEVGKHLGLSKSWTSRLHARAIEKLGRLLKDLLDEYGDERPLLPKKKPGGRKPAQRSGAPRR